MPHHTTHGVHGGVGAHQLVAAIPIHLADHCRARDGETTLHPVPNTLDVLGDPGHGKPVVANYQVSDVMRLPATTGIEDGLVEKQPSIVAIRLENDRVHRLGVGVCRIDTLGHGALLGVGAYDTGFSTQWRPYAGDVAIHRRRGRQPTPRQ